jgi:amidase
MDELAFSDATAQAELVRRGEVEPRELVEAAVARIERLDPTLNAVVIPLFDQALERARGPLPEGPFTGVPFVLKDLIAEQAGALHREGSAFLEGYVSRHDQELVVRHRRAGLIVVGKTNVPEFGILPTTEPRLFGPTRNPWDLERSPGGSSGGTAAAVAAGMVPMGHGSDGGGSIRIPASCCGLFGLKPTRGRITLGPALGDVMSGLVCEHALTRSVRDSAALLDATAGPAPGDPYSAPEPARPFAEEVKLDPGRLRIAVTTEAPTGLPVDPECVAAVTDAARLCESLGHEIVEHSFADLDAGAITDAFLVLWSAGQAALVDWWARRLGREPGPEQLEPLTRALSEMGRQRTAGDYLLAVGFLQQVSRRIADAFTGFDVLLSPTMAEPPARLGAFEAPEGEPLFPLLRATPFATFTVLANVTGQPAMSVPLYWTRSGLPIGVMFTGRFGDEATLFRLAAQLEAARPWAGRRPPLGTGT